MQVIFVQNPISLKWSTTNSLISGVFETIAASNFGKSFSICALSSYFAFPTKLFDANQPKSTAVQPIESIPMAVSLSNVIFSNETISSWFVICITAHNNIWIKCKDMYFCTI